MKILKLFTLLLIVASATAFSRGFLSYQEKNDFLQTAPGAFKYGLLGYDNPALLNYMRSPEFMFVASDMDNKLKNLDRWGLFYGSEGFSFGAITNYDDSGRVINDYKYSLGFGDRNFSLGIGYGWSNGDRSAFDRAKSNWTFGALYRPLEYVSLGLHYTVANDGPDAETVADIAVRPIPDYLLTFFADFAIFNDQKIKDAPWSAGVSWEFLDGIRLNGRYFSDKRFAAGVDVSLGHIGFAAQSHFDDQQEFDFNSYSIRVGGWDRSIIADMMEKSKYVKLELGTIKYNRNPLFFFMEDNSQTLSGILSLIDEAQKTESIKGIVINTSKLSASREVIWEIREKLKEFQKSGKKIAVYIERGGVDVYHFASVADKIIMDPLGSLMLSGYSMGKSYFKDMFDDLGVGVEEFRYFKYKSAVETLSRNGMSDADREQLQRIIDEWYDIAATEISQGRGFDKEQFDEFVNGELIYSADMALDSKLIDKKARWYNIDKVIKELDKSAEDIPTLADVVQKIKPIDDQWSEPDRIAIVYAIGECAMESGIQGRELQKIIEQIYKEKSIKAIVLRVDSPGGDAMASDYIADVIKENKGKKPLIVSQGMLAASGGYWLSMYGDTIVAAPGTITGSIGVIGSWFYNKGLKEDLKIKTDIVKAGKFSDLGFAFSLPLIGFGVLPDRNMTEEELGMIEKSIKNSYKLFVTSVAEGRGMEYDEVDKIAQGRVWSGRDGLENGLVDVIGGLDKAVELAKEAAGIDADEDITIVELMPKSDAGLLDVVLGLSNVNTDELETNLRLAKFMLENNGIVMPMVPMEFLNYTPNE